MCEEYCIGSFSHYIHAVPRAYHGMVAFNQLIYVIGGFDGVEYFSSVRSFNPVTKEWTDVAPMNSKRYSPNKLQLTIFQNYGTFVNYTLSYLFFVRARTDLILLYLNSAIYRRAFPVYLFLYVHFFIGGVGGRLPSSPTPFYRYKHVHVLFIFSSGATLV